MSEIQIDAFLVRRLIANQFPHWSHLPITPVHPAGWDNRTFRLGETMSVRLPSAARYAVQVEKEQRWLPKLALQLPLPIPQPLAMGEPACGYPWRWSIYRWVEGEPARRESVADLNAFAQTLAHFLAALQQVNATGGPPAGPENFFRGGSLRVYDAETRRALAALDGQIDVEAATAIWERALASAWSKSPVWFHGDMSAGNLLVRNGMLHAVIDFGTSGVGDPACDLAIAWTFFSGESRETFRTALALDEETWMRGRGWALWKASILLAGHAQSNVVEMQQAQRTLHEVLMD
uniref:Aminoglycoside phosphotransferase family protein n=1 Tax=Caldilinea aerophila TaxID=133453 RepID=A0A7C1JDF9_9CHLR